MNKINEQKGKLEYCNNIIEDTIESFKANSRFLEMDKVMQHGSTTVLDHSIKVAYLSCMLAVKFNIEVDFESLIKGALLHDYFLYDRKDNLHEGFHGFTHPRVALKNAREDFEINKVEADIILRHMFPLTITPPRYNESWVVCLADTMSATEEFFNGYKNLILNKLVKE